MQIELEGDWMTSQLHHNFRATQAVHRAGRHQALEFSEPGEFYDDLLSPFDALIYYSRQVSPTFFY